MRRYDSESSFDSQHSESSFEDYPRMEIEQPQSLIKRLAARLNIATTSAPVVESSQLETKPTVKAVKLSRPKSLEEALQNSFNKLFPPKHKTNNFLQNFLGYNPESSWVTNTLRGVGYGIRNTITFLTEYVWLAAAETLELIANKAKSIAEDEDEKKAIRGLAYAGWILSLGASKTFSVIHFAGRAINRPIDGMKEAWQLGNEIGGVSGKILGAALAGLSLAISIGFYAIAFPYAIHLAATNLYPILADGLPKVAHGLATAVNFVAPYVDVVAKGISIVYEATLAPVMNVLGLSVLSAMEGIAAAIGGVSLVMAGIVRAGSQLVSSLPSLFSRRSSVETLKDAKVSITRVEKEELPEPLPVNISPVQPTSESKNDANSSLAPTPKIQLTDEMKSKYEEAKRKYDERERSEKEKQQQQIDVIVTTSNNYINEQLQNAKEETKQATKSKELTLKPDLPNVEVKDVITTIEEYPENLANIEKENANSYAAKEGMMKQISKNYSERPGKKIEVPYCAAPTQIIGFFVAANNLTSTASQQVPVEGAKPSSIN